MKDITDFKVSDSINKVVDVQVIFGTGDKTKKKEVNFSFYIFNKLQKTFCFLNIKSVIHKKQHS